MKLAFFVPLLTSTFAYSQNTEDLKQQLQMFLGQSQENYASLSNQLSLYLNQIDHLTKQTQHLQNEINELKDGNEILQSEITELKKDKKVYGVPCFFNITVEKLEQHHKIVLEDVHLVNAPFVQIVDVELNNTSVASVSGMHYEGSSTIIYLDIDPTSLQLGYPAGLAISGVIDP